MSIFTSPLPGEAVIRLRGGDIPTFLQGQLTCDLRRLTPEESLRGALCNVKGRVISDVRVLWLNDEEVLLRLRRSLAPEFAQTLQRYAQFSRITVTYEPSGPQILGIYGDLTEAGPASGLFTELANGHVSRQDGLLALRSSISQGEIILLDTYPDIDPDTALEALGVMASPGDSAHWQAETLRDGHYAVEASDSETYTPQALNYDERGLVAFDKGCYTGQEVVARLHYKGKSKRRLQVYRCEGDAAPADTGAPLMDEHGTRVGACLRLEQTFDDQCLLAAEVTNELRHKALILSSQAQLTPLPQA